MASRVPEPRSVPAPRSIGELCVDGDWACAHGDVRALENIVRRLAERLTSPVCSELDEIADLCRTAPEDAFEAWMRVKEHVWSCQP